MMAALKASLPTDLQLTAVVAQKAELITVDVVNTAGQRAQLLAGEYSAAAYSGLTTCAKFDAVDQAARPAGAQAASCGLQGLPDGAKVLVVVTADDEYGFYDYEDTLFEGDTTLYLPTGGSVDVTGATPPITQAQLLAICQEKLWPVEAKP
jgi:hypothetical protein